MKNKKELIDLENLTKLIQESKNKKCILDRKPIILTDQDDVLANLISCLLKRYNKKYETNFTLDDITDWNLEKILGTEINEFLYDKENFLHLETMPYAKECLKLLCNSDLFDIYICSAAHPISCENKFFWIKENLEFFDTSKFITTCYKNLIHGDILFDDAPHNIIEFQHGQPIIFDKPYNQHLTGYIRVNGWLEFTEYILKKYYP